MTAKEIVTLQLGHYANFVGTHWWNIQESTFEYGKSNDESTVEIDHDVLFREGCTDRGEVTFTPRLVLAELKGGLGSLPEESPLYVDDCQPGYPETWDGEVTVHERLRETKNQFLRDLECPNHNKDVNGAEASRNYGLENEVKVWSDYLRTFLHPKSTVIVNDYHYKSSHNPFDLWTKGSNLTGIIEEIEERIRFYAEECNSLQGFHIIADSDNGFSGLSSSLMPYLKDEFSSKELVSFPVNPAKYVDENMYTDAIRKLNSSLSLSVLTGNSSLVLPLSLQSDCKSSKHFNGVIYDVNLSYHTSAIIASALDTFTLRHRLKGSSRWDLDDFQMNLAAGSKNLICTSLMMPFPFRHHNYDPKQLKEFFLKPVTSTTITPNISAQIHAATECFSHCVTVRGFDHCSNKIFQHNGHQHNGTIDLDDLVQEHLMRNYPGTKTSSFIMKKPINTTAPFPNIFQSAYQHTLSSKIPNGNGDCHQTYTNGHALPVKSLSSSIPALTSLQCTSKAVGIFDSAATSLHRSRERCTNYGIETDDLDSQVEYLLSMKDEYKPDTCDSDDSDGDFDI